MPLNIILAELLKIINECRERGRASKRLERERERERKMKGGLIILESNSYWVIKVVHCRPQATNIFIDQLLSSKCVYINICKYSI